MMVKISEKSLFHKGQDLNAFIYSVLKSMTFNSVTENLDI